MTNGRFRRRLSLGCKTLPAAVSLHLTLVLTWLTSTRVVQIFPGYRGTDHMNYVTIAKQEGADRDRSDC